MNQRKPFIIKFSFLIFAFAFQSFVQATVDWDEGFEYADDAALGKVWEHSCLGNPGISNDRAHSGSKSVKLVYRGTVGIDPGAGGCGIGRKLSAKSDTLYTRFYMYMENFTVNSTQTKMSSQGPYGGTYPSFWWSMNWGTPNLGINVQGIIMDDGKKNTVNVIGGPIPQNQWVCIEMRLTMSDPGVDNGIIQAWINGQITINKTNQRMRAATLNYGGDNSGAPNSPTTQFEYVTLYTQHGWGTIYYDDYAVSRDARIGYPGIDTLPEYNPPVIGQQVPAKNAIGIAPDAGISFHLTDKTGVDPASVVMQVSGVTVKPTVSGSPLDMSFTYTPANLFIPNSTVAVKVDAKDVLGNPMSQIFYTFKIASNASIRALSAPSAQGPVFLQYVVGRSTELIVNTQREGLSEIRIVGVSGNCAGSMSPQVLRAGPNQVQIDFNGKEIGKGIFFVVLKQGSTRSVFPLIKICNY